MQMFIPSVLSALEALLKGPAWLLWKVISIFFGRRKSPPPPPIPPSALCSLSDSPYESAHSQHQRSYERTRSQQQTSTYHPYRPPRPSAEYSQSPSAHERPITRAPQVPVVPVVIDPHEHPAARAPEVPVARVVIDPHEDPKSLRLKATQEGDRMEKCIKERNEARAGNEQPRAKELNKRGSAHRVNMILLNKEASAKIFQENNQNCRNEVDLHGLYVSEALSYFDISVREARDREESSLRVIVGKGNHSDNNIPKVKPAILAHGESLGLSIEVDPRNDGCLIVSF